MKNTFISLFVLACAVLIVFSGSAQAQNKRVGTATGMELLIPVGGRDLAMGGSGIATSQGVNAIFWNPAGMGRMGKSSAEAMFSSMTYIADIGVSYGAVAASFGDFGVVGFSVKSLNFGDIPITTADDPEASSGRFYSPTMVNVGMSYARPLTDAIAVGGTIKVISNQIDQVSQSGFALDFGVQYNGLAGVQGLELGVTLKNIGPELKFDGPGLLRVATSTDGSRPAQRYSSVAASFELPSVVELGLAYDSKVGDNMSLSLNGAFSNNNLYNDEYKVGGELGINLDAVTVFGRGGVSLMPQAAEDENIFGGTFGVGIFYPAPGINITVDYGYRSVQYFSGNQVVSVKLGF